MIDLIYDCDITMGLPGRDVDDGLALLYLLGSPHIRLLGVTSTFGNSSIEEVHPCLLSVLEDMGRADIPAYRGISRDAIKAASMSPGAPGGGDPRADSEAARFLAERVRSNPGTVSILATGSPTNMLGAYRLHPGFFRDVKQVVFMGGITEPLIINDREMAELNLASDPDAALYALYAGQPPAAANGSADPARPSTSVSAPPRCPTTVISGNLCLQAILSRKRFAAFLEESNTESTKGFVAYLEQMILPWFSWIERVYGLSGFHAWDATAALYLTDPQLFEPRNVLLRSTLEDLKRGFLRIAAAPGDQDTRRIDIPTGIRDLQAYWQTLFEGLQKAGTEWPE
jgi:purine nucleosidase